MVRWPLVNAFEKEESTKVVIALPLKDFVKKNKRNISVVDGFTIATKIIWKQKKKSTVGVIRPPQKHLKNKEKKNIYSEVKWPRLKAFECQ